jgi:PadR family transcriptional regulator, regulatory protein PadR
MSAIHLTIASFRILQALAGSFRYGFDIMEATGLPSGTVYPALKRFERLKFVRGTWENQRQARLSRRPARRYYELTETGRKYLGIAVERFPALAAPAAVPPEPLEPRDEAQ